MERDVEDIYELTPLQQGILFHTQYAPDSDVYNTQLEFTLSGELDARVFAAAWDEVVARHPTLRTSFFWEDLEQPYQVVHPAGSAGLVRHDWCELSEDERTGRLAALRESDQRRTFDLREAPLMRLSLVRTGADQHHFVWTFHHILLEGWSAAVLLQEVGRLYNAGGSTLDAALDTPRPFVEFIRWLGRQDASAAEAYWRRTLQGRTEPTHLPIDRAAGDMPAQVRELAEQRVDLGARETAALQALAKDARVTPSTVIQGLWSILVSRYTGEEDVVFGVVTAGRPPDLPGSESMVGLFVNTLPTRVAVTDEPLVPWLQRLQGEQAEMRLYDYSALAQVQGWSDVPSGRPLFDSVVVFENWQGDLPSAEWLRGVRIEGMRAAEGSDLPLTLVIAPRDGLELQLRYDVQRFEHAAVERVLGQLQNLVRDVLRDPERPVSELGLLGESERALLVEKWSGSRTEYPRDATISELFAQQVERTPDNVALSLEGEALTYRELDTRANQLARWLRGQGVDAGTRVGLCTERSLERVVGILGILKAGGAYVPLDPDYPATRLQFMVKDTAAPLVLTQVPLLEKLGDPGAEVFCLDRDWSDVAGAGGELLPADFAGTGPLDPAYVIYTSGSTGTPKGTCVAHRSVVRLVHATNFVDFGPDEVFLQLAAISFDASTFELWGSLLHGSKLVLFPAGVPSLAELGKVIREEGVTTLWLTAALFHQMVDEQLDSFAGVRQLLAGGDSLSVPHVKRLIGTLEGERRLINGYGPTENTTFTCCHVMASDSEIGDTVPIGRPISNSTVYLLDSRGEPVPVGVAGTLYTGGDGVALEYLNQPELTAERFVPDPFSQEAGARLYNTGDRARWCADGTIEFLGRIDQQVKIRGFRVELGEISSALIAHPLVRDAAVVTLEGDPRLFAYVVAESAGEAPTAPELRAFVRERLPEYMVPAAFVTLERLPVTPNGKLDRKALPAPEGKRQVEQAYVAPKSELERRIAAVWCDVLGIEQVGIDDNFFDLGGNSLLLMRVHGRLGRVLPRELPIVELFRFPTTRSLAERASQEEDETPSFANTTDRARRQREALARRKRAHGRRDKR